MRAGRGGAASTPPPARAQERPSSRPSAREDRRGADAQKTQLAMAAAEVPPRAGHSNDPERFFSRMARRERRELGDRFGLASFGINLAG